MKWELTALVIAYTGIYTSVDGEDVSSYGSRILSLTDLVSQWVTVNVEENRQPIAMSLQYMKPKFTASELHKV